MVFNLFLTWGFTINSDICVYFVMNTRYIRQGITHLSIESWLMSIIIVWQVLSLCYTSHVCVSFFFFLLCNTVSSFTNHYHYTHSMLHFITIIIIRMSNLYLVSCMKGNICLQVPPIHVSGNYGLGPLDMGCQMWCSWLSSTIKGLVNDLKRRLLYVTWEMNKVKVQYRYVVLLQESI